MIKVLTALLVLFIVVGLSLGGWLVWFYVHSTVEGALLLRQAQSRIDAARHDPIAEHGGTKTCSPSSGATGELVVPSIGLVAPVVQGDTDAELSDAVGHVPTSAWPGGLGTTVLEGHDVTWFHEIDQLKAGDRIEYLSGCTSFTYRVTSVGVVTKGSTIHNLDGQMVLVTCWPLDALWFTGQRLVVTAVEVGGARHAEAVIVPHSPPVPALAVPPALVGSDSLASNPTPLGALSISGDPTLTYRESPGPLADAGAAQSLYFAGLRAAVAGSSVEWKVLAPSIPLATAAPLVSAAVNSYLHGLTTTLVVSGTTLVGAHLRAEIDMSGSQAGAWYVTVGETVVNGLLEVTTWNMVPA